MRDEQKNENPSAVGKLVAGASKPTIIEWKWLSNRVYRQPCACNGRRRSRLEPRLFSNEPLEVYNA